MNLPPVALMDWAFVARSAPLMRGLKLRDRSAADLISLPPVARSAPLMRGLKLGKQENAVPEQPSMSRDPPRL